MTRPNVGGAVAARDVRDKSFLWRLRHAGGGPILVLSAASGLLLGLIWFAITATVAHELPVSLVALAALISADVAAVLLAARGLGMVAAIPVGTAGTVAIDWHLIPPTHDSVIPDASSAVALTIYLTASVLLGVLASVLRHRAEAAERARRLLAEEQGALRRVATLVARETPPDLLFAAVTEEAKNVLAVGVAGLLRFEPDGSTVVVAWAAPPDALSFIGLRIEAPAEPAEVASHLGVTSVVVSPVTVMGRPWGVMVVGADEGMPLIPGSEERLGEFTELLALAIANAQTRIELQASRARIVAQADGARRSLERDLHDGVQQHLVALALEARVAESAPDLATTREALHHLRTELGTTADELRELSHGLHPSIVSSGGLRPALATLTRRAGLPTELRYRGEGSPPEPVLLAAYYVVAEALTNIAKHAQADQAVVDVEATPTEVRLEVSDDGVGGADVTAGTGILGLVDRVEALGGHLWISTRAGAGTTLTIQLPYGSAHPHHVDPQITAARVAGAP